MLAGQERAGGRCPRPVEQLSKGREIEEHMECLGNYMHFGKINTGC